MFRDPDWLDTAEHKGTWTAICEKSARYFYCKGHVTNANGICNSSTIANMQRYRALFYNSA